MADRRKRRHGTEMNEQQEGDEETVNEIYNMDDRTAAQGQQHLQTNGNVEALLSTFENIFLRQEEQRKQERLEWQQKEDDRK